MTGRVSFRRNPVEGLIWTLNNLCQVTRLWLLRFPTPERDGDMLHYPVDEVEDDKIIVNHYKAVDF